MEADPFKLYFLMYRGQFRLFFQDKVVRLILVLALAGSLLVTLDLHLFNAFPIRTAVRQGFFCTISGLICTGLQNSNLHWVAGLLIVIMLLMMIGGAAGSTSGASRPTGSSSPTRGWYGGSGAFSRRERR